MITKIIICALVMFASRGIGAHIKKKTGEPVNIFLLIDVVAFISLLVLVFKALL